MSTTAVEQPLSYEEERGKPMPSLNHGITQANLIGQYLKHPEWRVVSELTLELDDQGPVTPDLSVYRRAPANMLHDIIRQTEPPVMTVEILSPTLGTYPVMEKVDRYFKAGVKSCWVVNPPARTITIYLPDGTDRTYVAGQQAVDPATGVTADVDTVFS